MFIRLLKTDGHPIWINAAFIVTIEPRKEGGSIVVPVGDGLDYDVQESAETVLSLLNGAPEPTVVPIPCTDAIRKAPVSKAPKADTQAEVETSEVNVAAAPDTTPAPKVGTKNAKRKTATSPRKRATARKTEGEVKNTKLEASSAPKGKDNQGKQKNALTTNNTLDLAEIERLRKLSPRSVKKLRNTLTAQFKINDVDAAIRSLELGGVLAVDRDHVNWK
jgi:uncharacterized protein YlzI (FlbEa/FlbD family)